MLLISDTLRDAICEQIGHEKYNANLYLHICGFLRQKGFDNLAKHFLSQHEEETGHSIEFFNLLTDLNAEIYIPQIDGIIGTNYASITTIAEFYLNREILTTRSIDEIKRLAIQDNNPVVEEKMREMIVKQQNEYEEASTFADNASLCGDDWWKVMVWDKSIGE
jgi:ferritin